MIIQNNFFCNNYFNESGTCPLTQREKGVRYGIFVKIGGSSVADKGA
jgi:hypothetical protein